MVFCGKCGKKNPDGQVYCYSCGIQLILGGNTLEDHTSDLDPILRDSGVKIYHPEPRQCDDDGGLSYEEKVKINKVRNFDQKKLDEIRRMYFFISVITGIVFIFSYFVMKIEITSSGPIQLYREEITMCDLMQVYDDSYRTLEQLLFIVITIGGLASFIIPTLYPPLFLAVGLCLYNRGLPLLGEMSGLGELEVANLLVMCVVYLALLVLMIIQCYFIGRICKNFTIDGMGTFSLLFFGHK